jgi:hypothetical protein
MGELGSIVEKQPHIQAHLVFAKRITQTKNQKSWNFAKARQKLK